MFVVAFAGVLSIGKRPVCGPSCRKIHTLAFRCRRKCVPSWAHPWGLICVDPVVVADPVVCVDPVVDADPFACVDLGIRWDPMIDLYDVRGGCPIPFCERHL